jgi:uroporphyrinogen-III synthase
LRVLVTRPLEQALATAAALRRRGHEPLLDPLLVIEPVPLPPLEPGRYAALLLTSANAVAAVPPALEALPAYCVGGATARAAEAAGLRLAGIGEDDGRALAGRVAERLRGGGRPLLHLAGADTAPGLAETLAAAGLACERVVAYRAVAAEALAPATREALAAGRLDAVLLLSPRSAELWCELVRRAGLATATPRLIAACLSPKVAAAAAALTWRRVLVARRRDEKALLDCLDAPG